MATREVFRQAIDTGAGTQTFTYPLDGVDLSWCDGLRLVYNGTKSTTDAADTLDIKLQARVCPTVDIWDTRIRLAAVIGNVAASASAPIQRIGDVQQWGTLADAEECYTPTGSADGSELTAGTVRNGLFPGRPDRRDTYNWRVVVVLTDADSDADFEGTVLVIGNAAE